MGTQSSDSEGAFVMRSGRRPKQEAPRLSRAQRWALALLATSDVVALAVLYLLRGS